MNRNNIIEELSIKYPGKKIIENDEENPTEILCEIEPTTDHPEYSSAIAVIEKSIPHLHRKLTETYTVIKGTITVYVDGKATVLNKGEKIIVQPNQVHWAEGNNAWIKCDSIPGWTIEDHMIQFSHDR